MQQMVRSNSSLADEIDPYFSFSPQEIRAFIRISANTPHSIDRHRALEIWQQQKLDVETRKSFVSDLIERVAEGLFRRERTGSELRASNLWLRSDLLLSKAFSEAMILRPERRWSHSSHRDFLIRSTLNEGASTNGSKKGARKGGLLSDEEYATLNVEFSNTSKPWKTAPENWCCACCARSKREICRKSNAGKWTARIFRHIEYLVETDYFIIEFRRAIYPAFIQEPIVSNEIRYTICQDCASISQQLKLQKPEITDHFYLTIADLQDSITATAPHHNHERNLSIAVDRVLANRSLAEAADAFSEHRNLAFQANMYFAIAIRSGFSEPDARAYAAMKLEAQRGLPEFGLRSFIDWLIGEGERLDWKKHEPFYEAAPEKIQ